MLRRTIIALLLIPLYALLMQSFLVALGFTVLAHLAAQLELTGLIQGLSRQARWTHCLLSSLLMAYMAWQLHTGSPVNLLLVLLFAILVYLVLSIRSAERGHDPDVLWLLVRALALITLPLAFLPQLAAYDGAFPYLLLLAGAGWGADVAAIFAGKLVGRTPLAPTLSPHKTVEGALAGIFAGGLIWAGALLFYPPDGALALLLHSLLPRSAAVPAMLLLGMVAAMLGIMGDLAFSLFKRQAHVKDYSHALPGHGGILDRCDSVLLLIPLVYAFAYGI